MMKFITENWFGVAVLVVVVYFLSGFSSTVVNNIPTVGGALQTSDFDAVNVKEFTQGGGVLNIAPEDTTTTLTQDQMLNNSVIAITASTTSGTQTITLPATSTLTELVPNAGDMRTWVFKNENTAAATTTTIAAGTGGILLEPDGQNVVVGGGNDALITMIRDDSTDVLIVVDEVIDAD